jgi:small subunit ribosomal protein S2
MLARAAAVVAVAQQPPRREYRSRRSRLEQPVVVPPQHEPPPPPQREARPQRSGRLAMMRPEVPSLSALMAAGVQWGKLHGRHTREMRQYLLPDAGHRWRYNVFDTPCATMPLLDDALAFLEKVAASSRDVLFVGVTPAARQAVSTAAQRCNSPFVVTRWVGGTLSNNKAIQRAIDLLDKDSSSDASKLLTGAAAKKAAMVAAKRRERAERKVGGLRGVTRLPGALFVVDAAKHAAVLAEAKTARIPVVAVCDSDTQHPLDLDYPIPANASGPGAVRLLAELAARAVLCGKKLEAPEATWEREVAEKREEGEAGEEEFAFYGPWRVAPLRTSLSGTGRRKGHKRHRLTRGGHTGGVLGRTQRRLQ